MTKVGRAAGAVAAAGLAVLAMWLYTLKPGIEARMQNPLVAKGRIGAAVDTPEFSVKVQKVDVAAALSKPGFLDEPPTVMKSLGLFVVVQAQIKSNKKPFQPGHVRLETRGGLSYDESGRTAIFSSDGEYQPMLWAPATYIFEIPKDRLAGMRLVLGNAALINSLSGETSIDLGVDGDRAARLAAHPAAAYVLQKT